MVSTMSIGHNNIINDFINVQGAFVELRVCLLELELLREHEAYEVHLIDELENYIVGVMTLTNAPLPSHTWYPSILLDGDVLFLNILQELEYCYQFHVGQHAEMSIAMDDVSILTWSDSSLESLEDAFENFGDFLDTE